MNRAMNTTKLDEIMKLRGAMDLCHKRFPITQLVGDGSFKFALKQEKNNDVINIPLGIYKSQVEKISFKEQIQVLAVLNKEDELSFSHKEVVWQIYHLIGEEEVKKCQGFLVNKPIIKENNIIRHVRGKTSMRFCKITLDLYEYRPTLE